MSKLQESFRQRRSEIFRAVIVAGILFAVTCLVDSTLWRGLWFALLVIFFILMRAFSSSAMAEDLRNLTDDMERMAEGNLLVFKSKPSSADVVVRDFSTSLLVLTGRFHQIVEKVKNVGDNFSNTSERIMELSRFLLRSGQNQSHASENASQAIAEINAAIKRIAAAAESLNELGITASSAALQLTASIEKVTRNALQVGVFAKDTQASMEGMVHGMKEIEEASEMLTATSRDTDVSMQNMHKRISEVTQHATESDELAERASSVARTGGKVVADVEAGMEKIAEAFANVSNVIGHLSRRSEQIGEILNVITQVSDQTNLLSLNAAILSAQAGVHGKGFAVVADEIRKLSNRTASSVQEIEKLISSIQVEIKETVELMEARKGRLEEGFERSRKASDALSEILAVTSASRERVAAIGVLTRADSGGKRSGACHRNDQEPPGSDHKSHQGANARQQGSVFESGADD